MGFIFALVGDLGAFIVIWRGFKLAARPHQKMFETESDYKLRRLAGFGICVFGVVVIILNHFVFRF